MYNMDIPRRNDEVNGRNVPVPSCSSGQNEVKCTEEERVYERQRKVKVEVKVKVKVRKKTEKERGMVQMHFTD